MRLKTLDDIDFSVSIIEIPPGVKLEAFGPHIYAKNLEKVGSQILVISNKKITLSHKMRDSEFYATLFSSTPTFLISNRIESPLDRKRPFSMPVQPGTVPLPKNSPG